METEAITTRPPKSVVAQLRDLANRSGLSLSAYTAAILTDAAKREAIVQLIENVDVQYKQGSLPVDNHANEI